MFYQLENGKLFPRAATLPRISRVYYFFTNRRSKTFAVVLGAERLRFPDRADSSKPTYFFECLAFAVQSKGPQAYVAEFPLRMPATCRSIFTKEPNRSLY